jgi:hypothetical protein
MIYTALCVIVLMWAETLHGKGGGVGVGAGNREFFGPLEMARVFWAPNGTRHAYRLDAISQGPKNSRIPGPNPLPLALVMDMQWCTHPKHYARGCIDHRCINSSPTVNIVSVINLHALPWKTAHCKIFFLYWRIRIRAIYASSLIFANLQPWVLWYRL